ncbi:hypothetical protein [Nocardiopsis sp. NPDC057823]|uniref:hypothetical protein n=1 Tax=Nocardiopsis sp. NPDC057823 TaxID=3346256 RepID=UPI00366EFCD6
MRAPVPVASWSWTLEGPEGTDGLTAGAPAVLKVSDILQAHDLLYLQKIEVDWFEFGIGNTGFRSTILHCQDMTTEKLKEKTLESQPRSRPNSYPETLRIIGPGNWITPEGKKRGEPELLVASIDIATEDTQVEVSVYHDIWASNDFFGNPHHETYNANAPRLERALENIEKILGVEAEAGDPTYFGTSLRHGVESPRGGVSKSGLDVTDRL